MRKYVLLAVAMAGFVGVVWGDIAPPLPKPPASKPSTQPATATSAPATTKAAVNWGLAGLAGVALAIAAVNHLRGAKRSGSGVGEANAPQ